MTVRKSLDYYGIPRRVPEPFDHNVIVITSNNKLINKTKFIPYSTEIDVSAVVVQ